ncbi:MAG: hypothetical protein ACR2OW_05230 [Methyloligellaceae bacterium]
MKLDRRKFLGAAAASPLAAKEIAMKVAEEAQMEAANMSLYSDSIYTGVSHSDVDLPMRNLWDALKDLGIPDWKKEDLWEDAKRNRTLDPDIAAMNSLSLNAKLRKQWKRNYELLVDRAFKQTEFEQAKKLFFKDNPDISEW